MQSNLRSSASLPVIDLAGLDAGAGERARLLAELRRTARDVGFFYLTGHGIAPAQNDGLLAVARRFFALPEAEKQSVEMIHSPHFRGYTRAGRELTRGRPDWREQFDIGAERECGWRAGDPAWMRLQGPNQWPPTLPELRPILLAWQAAMTEVGVKLLRAFAEALGQSPDVFEPIYRGAPNQHIKIIRYPGRERRLRASRRAGRASVRIRTAAFSPSFCRMASAASKSRRRTAPGSRRRRARALSSSMSANCWNSPPMDIRAPPSIAWSRPRQGASGCRRPSFSGRATRRRRRSSICRWNSRPRRKGRRAIRTIRCSSTRARTISKGGCARIPTWRSAIMAKSDCPRRESLPVEGALKYRGSAVADRPSFIAAAISLGRAKIS